MSDGKHEGEVWRILARGVGRWEGDETMPPAPWAPDGMEARGTLEARLVLGGRGLSSAYEQRVGGQVTLRSHTLIRWDEAGEHFVMRFVPESGGEPTVLEGHRDGDRLIFGGSGPAGPMRQTFRYGVDDLGVLSESPAPSGDEGWTTTFEGAYHPSPRAAAPGSIGWHDLTVDDAEGVRDFYAAVVGWTPEPVSMGEYDDFNMVASGEPVAGVCHARGGNTGLPSTWLIYVVVEDIERAVAAADEAGGEVVAPLRNLGEGRMAVLRDPAGGVIAVYQP